MKSKYLLVFIFLLGLGLRLFNSSSHLFQNGGYDQARDLLVASHILNFNEHIKRGPEGFGGMGILINSVGYFYLVAFFLFFTKSPFVFMVVFNVLMSLQILLAYYVGQFVQNKKTGLIFATLVALSPELIYQSKNLYQPHLLPFFMLVFLFFMLKKHNKYAFYDYSLAAIALLLPLHFHYGVLLILPVATVWLLSSWFEFSKNHVQQKMIFFPVIVFCLTFLHWIYSTYNLVPFDQVGFVFVNMSKTIPTNFWSQLGAVISSFNQLIWYEHNLFYVLLNTIIISGLLIIYLHKKLRLKYKNKKLFWIFLLQLSLILAAFLKTALHPTYLSSLIPIFFLITSIFLSFLFKKLPLLSVSILLVIIFIFIRTNYQKEMDTKKTGKIYESLQSMSQIIFTNIKERQSNQNVLVQDFTIAILASDNTFGHDGWGTTPLWFFLEKFSGQKLINITDSREKANIEPKAESLKYVYFICEHRGGATQKDLDRCLYKFYFKHQYLGYQYPLLFQSQDFSMWLIKILNMPEAAEEFYKTYELESIYPSHLE